MNIFEAKIHLTKKAQDKYPVIYPLDTKKSPGGFRLYGNNLSFWFNLPSGTTKVLTQRICIHANYDTIPVEGGFICGCPDCQKLGRRMDTEKQAELSFFVRDQFERSMQ